MTHLDSVLDFTSVVSNDEGRLHDGRELDVAVSFMLTLELFQQGLIGSLGEAEKKVFLSAASEHQKLESIFLAGKLSYGPCFATFICLLKSKNFFNLVLLFPFYFCFSKLKERVHCH